MSQLKTLLNLFFEVPKRDIDEGHGHLEWIGSNYKPYQCLGLIFVGPDGICHEQASPSSEMHHCKLSIVTSVKDQLVAGIEDLRRTTPSERSNRVKTFCAQSQWAIDGLFSKISTKTMRSMK